MDYKIVKICLWDRIIKLNSLLETNPKLMEIKTL